MPELVEVRVLVAHPGGQYRSGETYEVPGEDARAMVRAGTAEFVVQRAETAARVPGPGGATRTVERPGRGRKGRTGS